MGRQPEKRERNRGKLERNKTSRTTEDERGGVVEKSSIQVEKADRSFLEKNGISGQYIGHGEDSRMHRLV